MTRVGIVGISGYSGLTALEILLKHPHARVTYVSANNTKGRVDDIWPGLKGLTDLVCDAFGLEPALDLCDVAILAVPHTVSMTIAPKLLAAGKRVIDLSGDYRLASPEDYKKWYGTDHADVGSLSHAVYGLPEFFRRDIKTAKLLSNPGCYPTAALLGLLPMVSTHGREIASIIIDAKSGVTGAGRKVSAAYIFSEVNENFKAYKVLNHQHAPEIERYLSRAGSDLKINFVPHLLPLNRGILETIYVHLKEPLSGETVHKIYKNFYKGEPFVRVLDLGQQPEIKNVVGKNYCDLAITVSADHRLLVVTSAIDNLLKGASGQAVQNLNIMCGFGETEGLL